MTVQATETKKQGFLSSALGGGKAIWVAAIVLALIAVFGALTILGNAAATQTYYVLGRDIAARTQITPEMLVAKEAKVDQAPPNALDPVAVRTGTVFSQIALKAGDVVSSSNAGPLNRITADVPQDFVAASFNAQPDIAVAGKVRSGDHIDLIATNDDGSAGPVSKVVLQHVLVLDVTVSPNSIAQSANNGQAGNGVANPGPESEAVRGGIPAVYTVAVSPEDATKLALARNHDLYVVLSGNVPDLNQTAQSDLRSLFNSAVTDSSDGSYASVYVIRYDHAFEVGNVWVDDQGNIWKVNKDKQWVKNGGAPLAAGQVPPKYLPLPVNTKFTDTKGVLWIALAQGDKTAWTSEQGQTLPDGTFPAGYDPHKEFPDTQVKN